eukprot:6490567-Amphidinium_carterae.2
MRLCEEFTPDWTPRYDGCVHLIPLKPRRTQLRTGGCDFMEKGAIMWPDDVGGNEKVTRGRDTYHMNCRNWCGLTARPDILLVTLAHA